MHTFWTHFTLYIFPFLALFCEELFVWFEEVPNDIMETILGDKPG